MALDLTLVIPCYREGTHIEHSFPELLSALHRSRLDFEVLFIDDCSPDDTASVVAELAPHMRFPVRFLRNECNSGPGYTQNRAIELARASVLLIMTDDVFMRPGALRAHLDYHRRYPEPEAAALGKVIQSPELRDTALMRNWDPFRFWLLESGQELPYYMFWACNVSCKTEFMREHGMFREHRGRAGAVAFEDLEVGYRLSRRGMALRYLDGAEALHYHPYTIDSGIARWYERGLNLDEFRNFVPDPVLTVYFHVLDRHTFAEYRAVLSGPNSFKGKERSFAWHMFRHLVQTAVLNRLTVALLWRPLIDAAERSPLAERLVNRSVYRAFFYYHFLRGVQDAYARFGFSDRVSAQSRH